MLPSLTEIRAEQARRSLLAYVSQSWSVVEPGTPFVAGFHIEAICEHLEALLRGESSRLLINIPPRHGKSLLASVFFQTWAWITSPELRFLYASYSQSLSVRDSVSARRLIESPWYRERFREAFTLTSDQNVKARFENDRTGARIASSVGGAATGEGGDILVVDDAHKIEEARSDPMREGVLEWFDTTLSTRLNNPRSGGIVVIGQRLHERDISGHLLAQGGWTHLCLPAEYEPSHPFLWPEDPRTQPGEPLWPERFGRTELESLKRSLGSYGAAGQLQQLPAPAGGGLFQREWWRWYDPSAPLPRFERLVQSWDLTFGATPGSDYVVGQVWGAIGPDKYLLSQFRERIAITETIAAIRAQTEWVNETLPGHRGHAILIEKAANGAAVIDMLRRELSGIIPVVPKGDKVSRAQAIAPQVEAGNVHLPGAPTADGKGVDRSRTPAWASAFVEETAAFPSGATDDQVDAATQALDRLTRPGLRIRVLR